MFSPLLMMQLQAARAACQSVVLAIDMFLAYVEDQKQQQEAQQQEPGEPAPGSPMVEPTPKCSHPPERIRSAPAMGNPNRRLCGLCNQEV